MRIHAVSDIHLDYSANLDWLQSLSNSDFTDDVLILAGDVSSDLAMLSRALNLLQLKFRKLCFVPGNHELWVKGSEYDCSLKKCNAIRDLCRELKVETGPYIEGGLTLVPLYSWYDYSFAEPDAYLKRAWRDYSLCAWPEHLSSSGDINRHFLQMNIPVLQQRNDVVISFSHFLPRIDLMPGRIPIKKRNVYPVLGSKSLGVQVAKLNPDLHVYGHSHVNQATKIEGVHYINNAFGYPSESHISKKMLKCVYQDGQLSIEDCAVREN